MSEESVDLLTSGEVAETLGVGPSTVKRWTESGELTCIKTLGGHRRFARSEVLEFAKRNGLESVKAPDAHAPRATDMSTAWPVMRAIVFEKPGDADVLELVERETPVPEGDEVRVRVHGSGLNRADLLQRRGSYPAPKGSPADILGLEYAGVIDAVGRSVVDFAVGDHVMGIVGGGAYAEQVLTRAGEVMRVPNSLDLVRAAAFPEAFLTAYDALFNEGCLQAGETVLVHAIGSGVGTAALQLARRAGARVIGTSRNKAKLEKARALGLVDGVVTEGDWPATVKALAPEGIDVVIDLVGGKLVPPTLTLLRDRGRHVLVGLTAGATAELDLGRLLSKRLCLRGTVLRSRPFDEKVRLARTVARLVIPELAKGLVQPVVDSLVAPANIREAHQRLERNESFGKLVIDWTGET